MTADETGAESAQLLDEFVSLQKEMFTALELHYRLAGSSRGQTGLLVASLSLKADLSVSRLRACVCVQSLGHADTGAGSSCIQEVRH